MLILTKSDAVDYALDQVNALGETVYVIYERGTYDVATERNIGPWRNCEVIFRVNHIGIYNFRNDLIYTREQASR